MNHPEQTRMDMAGDVFREDHDRLRRAPSGRRSFLGLLLGAGFASLGALLSVPLLRFLLHPLVKAKAQVSWKEIANVEDLASVTSPVKKLVQVEQRDGWRKIVLQKAVYVCRDERGQLFALSSVCPHLGCSIAWRDEENRFVCPCHNGQFTAKGKLLGGPPPRAMDQLESKVEDGKLVVHYQSFRQLVPDKEVIA
jgi:menaquinol-cytochrome c reductase iron-sulfur subunit